MTEQFINALREELHKPLPGIDAQFEMAHVNREKVNPLDLKPSDFRQSAVLLLLCRNREGIFFPLTERHIYKGAHSGQISLPGGKFDEKDETLENTALRECHEEIGIKDNIELLGSLTPVYIPVSGFMVHPYVGILNHHEQNYELNNAEVKHLVELQIKDLLDPALVKQTVVEPVPGFKLKTPYFDVQGKIIWGATAMILNEFKHVLLKITSSCQIQ